MKLLIFLCLFYLGSHANVLTYTNEISFYDNYNIHFAPNPSENFFINRIDYYIEVKNNYHNFFTIHLPNKIWSQLCVNNDTNIIDPEWYAIRFPYMAIRSPKESVVKYNITVHYRNLTTIGDIINEGGIYRVLLIWLILGLFALSMFLNRNN